MREGRFVVGCMSSTGLWVGLVCGSKVFTLRWVGLCWVSRLVGSVGLKTLDNSVLG